MSTEMFSRFQKSIPKKMQNSRAGYDGCNIDQNSRVISKNAGDIAEDDLSHRIIRTDIEHVNLPIRME